MSPMLPVLCPVVTEISSTSLYLRGAMGMTVYVNGPNKAVICTTYVTIPSAPQAMFHVTQVPRVQLRKRMP